MIQSLMPVVWGETDVKEREEAHMRHLLHQIYLEPLRMNSNNSRHTCLAPKMLTTDLIVPAPKGHRNKTANLSVVLGNSFPNKFGTVVSTIVRRPGIYKTSNPSNMTQ